MTSGTERPWGSKVGKDGAVLSVQRVQGKEHKWGGSGLEVLSKNFFILRSCLFLSGNNTVFFSQRIFLPKNTSHRIRLHPQSPGTN